MTKTAQTKTGLQLQLSALQPAHRQLLAQPALRQLALRQLLEQPAPLQLAVAQVES